MSNHLESLLSCWECLGDSEKRILATLAKRLYSGQMMYGKIATGKKEWTVEASEEALDAAVYLAALLSDSIDRADARAQKVMEEEMYKMTLVRTSDQDPVDAHEERMIMEGIMRAAEREVLDG